jgi:hypothetical protein
MGWGAMVSTQVMRGKGNSVDTSDAREGHPVR